MAQSYKLYKYAFRLEETKLTRLMDVIGQNFATFPNVNIHHTFEVFLPQNQSRQRATLEEVFSLDNSKKNKIHRLVLTSTATAVSASRPEHEIIVDFGRTLYSNVGSSQRIVDVTIRSTDAIWCDRTLSEVEEQVERTRSNIWPFVLSAALIIVCTASALLHQFLASALYVPRNLASSMWLEEKDVPFIRDALASHAVLTQDQLAEIYTRQMSNVISQNSAVSTINLTSKMFFTFDVPIIFFLICSVILICSYPAAVFPWGDGKERYSRIERRRNFIWGSIILAFVLAIIVNLSTAGLSQLTDR